MTPYNIFIGIIIFLAGLSFGSFLNVLVYRLPNKESLVTPPSRCPSCGHRLGTLELVPLVGYLALRGRCRHCDARIALRYPIVELITAVLFLLVYFSFGLTIEALFNLILLYLLLAIALIDLEHRIVPNILVGTGLAAAVILYLPTIAATWADLPVSLMIGRSITNALGGFLAGGLILLLVYLISRGGLGAGDVKLMAMIGLYVGLSGTAVVLMLAFLMGALVGLLMIIMGRLTRKDALPFAPYLAAAAFINVFWGEAIWNWYINLLN